MRASIATSAVLDEEVAVSIRAAQHARFLTHNVMRAFKNAKLTSDMALARFASPAAATPAAPKDVRTPNGSANDSVVVTGKKRSRESSADPETAQASPADAETQRE